MTLTLATRVRYLMEYGRRQQRCQQIYKSQNYAKNYRKVDPFNLPSKRRLILLKWFGLLDLSIKLHEANAELLRPYINTTILQIFIVCVTISQ